MAFENTLILILQTVELNYRGSEINSKYEDQAHNIILGEKKIQIITKEPGKKSKFLSVL